MMKITIAAFLLGAAVVSTYTQQAAGAARAAVQGVVRFEGTAPAAERLDMSRNAFCAGLHGGQPVLVKPVDVDGSGGMRDVVVYVKGSVRGGTRALPAEPVVLDQKGCTYEPRLIALAVQQPLLIRNSDATLHNVHAHAKTNRSFNIAQPRAGMETRRTFTLAEHGIAVTCDVHDWMASAIAVFDHPYFAVTGADGTFSIDGLPPGEYTLEAWHPRLGTQTARVTVSAAGAAPTTFVFRAS